MPVTAMLRASATMLRASATMLETPMTTLARLPGVLTMTDALEGMRPLFTLRTIAPCRYTLTVWSTMHFGAGNFRPTACIRTTADLATALK